MIPEAIKTGYRHEATKIAKAIGLDSLDAMSMVLSEEDAAAALSALVSGDQRTFSLYVQKTMTDARNVASEEWFKQELASAGVRLNGTEVIFPDGLRMDVTQAILRGVISFE